MAFNMTLEKKSCREKFHQTSPQERRTLVGYSNSSRGAASRELSAAHGRSARKGGDAARLGRHGRWLSSRAHKSCRISRPVIAGSKRLGDSPLPCLRAAMMPPPGSSDPSQNRHLGLETYVRTQDRVRSQHTSFNASACAPAQFPPWAACYPHRPHPLQVPAGARARHA